jgi:uncharacterized membrane protein YidH (DUF202 family)
MTEIIFGLRLLYVQIQANNILLFFLVFLGIFTILGLVNSRERNEKFLGKRNYLKSKKMVFIMLFGCYIFFVLFMFL